ncbi:MAG: Na/Pi cotransporter family protein [Candidatus Omnitrophica bacterium]|jgi:phosphate:Na+ symporter|nr:Na/Pi cotransporter family protein [Candidatus Omnitrophota bacterium]
MADLNNVKEKVNRMAKTAATMWQLTYDAFIEHDLELITKALEEEKKLNALEDEINQSVIDLGRADAPQNEKLRIIVYADIAGDLELIGDYCKDILERIQIKIEEKLLFSEGAVEEYKDLYNKTKGALEEVVFVLEKDNPALIKEVLRKEEHIDSLVDKYRSNHDQRMLAGECTPMGCNMFLNMLDFTAAVYYHIKKIAKSLLQIK